MQEFIDEMVEELLDMDGDVEIAGIKFRKSYILKELDPIAYREVAINIVNSQIEDLEYELDFLDEETDADEIADIKERIVQLENY